MAIVTLGELMTRARERADMVDDDFVSDPTLVSLINNYVRELIDKLVKAYGEDYFARSAAFSTSATSIYSLSVLTSGSFYKLRGLDEQAPTPSGWRDVHAFNLANRNNGGSIVRESSGDARFRYRIAGDSLVIQNRDGSTPSVVVPMQLHWIPTQAALSHTTNDTFDDINGWSEFVVLSAAIAMKDMSEQDTKVLQNDRARIEERITAMAPARDAGEPLMMPAAEHTLGNDAALAWLVGWRR